MRNRLATSVCILVAGVMLAPQIAQAESEPVFGLTGFGLTGDSKHDQTVTQIASDPVGFAKGKRRQTLGAFFASALKIVKGNQNPRRQSDTATMAPGLPLSLANALHDARQTRTATLTQLIGNAREKLSKPIRRLMGKTRTK